MCVIFIIVFGVYKRRSMNTEEADTDKLDDIWMVCVFHILLGLPDVRE